MMRTSCHRWIEPQTTDAVVTTRKTSEACKNRKERSVMLFCVPFFSFFFVPALLWRCSVKQRHSHGHKAKRDAHTHTHKKKTYLLARFWASISQRPYFNYLSVIIFVFLCVCKEEEGGRGKVCPALQTHTFSAFSHYYILFAFFFPLNYAIVYSIVQDQHASIIS